MDIFDRIENKEKITFENGFWSCKKLGTQKANVPQDLQYRKPAHLPNKEWSAETLEKTTKLYKYIMSIYSKGSDYYKSLTEQEKQEIYENIEKMLKEGVNFDFFEKEQYADIFFYVRENVIRLLYDYGMDMQKGFENAPIIYLYEKNLYDCLTTEQILGSPAILRNMSASVLQEVIESRPAIEVDSVVIDPLLASGDYEYTTFDHAQKIECLFANGVIKLSSEQLEKARAKQKTDMVSKAYDMHRKKEKYSTKKTLEEKTTDAQKDIQKIFDDAQNLVK